MTKTTVGIWVGLLAVGINNEHGHCNKLDIDFVLEHLMLVDTERTGILMAIES